jgi:hypothetical protein
MQDNRENLVPKVHPATRAVEADDPYNLHGIEVPGDPQFMLRMLVEEYARMGWDGERLLALFRDPFYQGAHGLWRHFGEAELRKRVAALLTRTGVIRVRAVAAPSADELVSLSIPSQDCRP